MPHVALPNSSWQQTILVVDDDELLRRSLGFTLEQAGYSVQMAAAAQAALEMIQSSPPDLVLLDIGLPDINGLEAIRRIGDACPVIFVSGRQRQLDEVLGLELGAEDYITKPFDPDVLLARIRNVLRRTATVPSTVLPRVVNTSLVAGDLSIDSDSHRVICNGKQIPLSPLEFRLLHTLVQETHRVVSTEELLQRVWGEQYVGESQNVYVYIRTLREKVEENPQAPQRILTVRGVGYRYVPREPQDA